MASNDAKRRVHFTYLWKIESTSTWLNLKSPVFTVPPMELSKWYLTIHFIPSLKSIDLFIERNEEDDGPESIEVDFELSFLDTSRSSLIEKSESGHFRKKARSERVEFFDDSLWEKRGGWLFPKDPLTIRCRLWRKGTEVSESELCFASTRFDRYRASCVWAVKEISSLKMGEKRSRILDFGEKGCPKLILFFSLAKEKDKERVFIHLEKSNVNSPFRIFAEITFLSVDGVESHSKKYSTYVGKDITTADLGVFEKTTIATLLSEDVPLLRCELELFSIFPAWSRIVDYKLMDYSNTKMVQGEKKGMNSDVINETAVCPFKEIVNTFKEKGTLSDVSLRAGTKSFPVHKLILGSRSPVFRAMFTGDMREKTSKCIDIPDMDADTLGRLLSYIYQDTLQVQDLTWEKAVNLYEAADEYAILNLKEKCSSVLTSNISESSFCKILVIADMHQDESLKKSVQQFIQNNPEIMHSEMWKVFKEENSKLAFQIAEQIIFNLKRS